MLKKTLSQIIHAIQVRGKPFCVHCEVQHIPEFQRRLKKFLASLRYKPVLYCLTPANKDFVHATFGLSGNDFEEQLKTAYSQLKTEGYLIELHVHLTKLANMLSFKQKKKAVENALEWMAKSDFNVSELALGWSNQENGMEHIASSLGLKLMDKTHYRIIHDYEL